MYEGGVVCLRNQNVGVCIEFEDLFHKSVDIVIGESKINSFWFYLLANLNMHKWTNYSVS